MTLSAIAAVQIWRLTYYTADVEIWLAEYYTEIVYKSGSTLYSCCRYLVVGEYYTTTEQMCLYRLAQTPNVSSR